jgi:3-oxo-5alpha-steroid 4-dehydrogenase
VTAAELGRRTVRPLPLSEVDSFDEQTDVLVVGYGCAGAAAALGAAESGAEVVVLEKLSGGGGSSAVSGGEVYLGGGTAIQQACGFDDSPEEMAKFLLAALGPDADAEKVQRYCEGSVAHFDWLVRCGVPFKPSMWDAPTWVPPTDDGLMWLGENSWPFTEIAAPAPRGHRPASVAFGGWLLMERLFAAVSATPVQVRTDSSATRLITAADGAVVGAVVRHFDRRYTVRARRGVIVTTGGFVDNPQMVARHAPQLIGMDPVSDGGDDGRGILMAQAAGADVAHMAAAQAAITVSPGVMVRGIVVNGRGQRFINEDTYAGRIGQAALFQQNMDVWVIVDEAGFEEVPEGERMGMRPFQVAGSAAELAELIGLDPAALQATVDRYNDAAGRGEDPLCHKAARWLRPLEPPIAAVKVRGAFVVDGRPSSGVSVFTLGGLRTGVDGEVLDLDGQPIPGLYAAGRASFGLPAWGYISGTSLGDGTFFGRRAGRAAADG